MLTKYWAEALQDIAEYELHMILIVRRVWSSWNTIVFKSSTNSAWIEEPKALCHPLCLANQGTGSTSWRLQADVTLLADCSLMPFQVRRALHGLPISSLLSLSLSLSLSRARFLSPPHSIYTCSICSNLVIIYTHRCVLWDCETLQFLWFQLLPLHLFDFVICGS